MKNVSLEDNIMSYQKIKSFSEILSQQVPEISTKCRSSHSLYLPDYLVELCPEELGFK